MTREKPRRKEERSLLSPGGLIPLKPWGACLASWGWGSRWQSGQPGSKVGTRRDCSHSKWEFAKDTKPWGRGERREDTVNLLLVKPLVGSFLLKKKQFFFFLNHNLQLHCYEECINIQCKNNIFLLIWKEIKFLCAPKSTMGPRHCTYCAWEVQLSKGVGTVWNRTLIK